MSSLTGKKVTLGNLFFQLILVYIPATSCDYINRGISDFFPTKVFLADTKLKRH